MSETKFTPGPWSLDTVITSCGICHRIGPFPYNDTGARHACIYVDYNTNADELASNAHLISAAPDLYGELYFQVLNCPSCKGTGISVDTLHFVMTGEERDQDCIRCKGGRSALAKARGES